MYRDEILKSYAELSLKVGVNLQEEQLLVVQAPLETYPFVHQVVQTAYRMGARYVHVEWSDEEIQRIRLKESAEQNLGVYHIPWRARGYEEMAREHAALLNIYAPKPDLLKDVEPYRVAMATKAASAAMQGFQEYVRAGRISWSIVAMPSREWAQKVFPALETQEAMERLWSEIQRAIRLTEPDPVAAWEKHIAGLKQKLRILNDLNLAQLHYTAPGTDLRVALPEGHEWHGASMINERGLSFVPNIPTEEVFTLPHRTGINGVVRSTKPLNYNGTLIENFSFTFQEGRIVHFQAEKGEATLRELLDTDEGSRYLGEIALVPHQSPISQSNLIFYNTLFDENASCHLAIGSAYPFCLKGGTGMSKEELKEKGANDSLTHVDFMIGSAALNIDGYTRDGRCIPIFRQGNWAPEAFGENH